MTNEKPYCFGKLDTVFPVGDDGLRHSPESCMYCRVKTECLKTAVQGDGGADVFEEKLEREYESGRIGFFERWKRKKDLHKLKMDQKKKPVK